MIDGKAPPILNVVDNPDAIVEDAAIRLFPTDDSSQRTAVTRMKFRQIAAEEFTIMLARITPLDTAL